MPTQQRVLAVRSDDPVLHHVAPLGLAAAAGTALVVDLDPASPSYPGPTLADLSEEGLRHDHLVPRRAGVAVVGHGGIAGAEAEELVGLLTARWPAVVLRAGPGPCPVPVVPVRALLPGLLAPSTHSPGVFQTVAPGSRLPHPGIALPPLHRGQVTSMLLGRVEPRWRWVRAWRRVWEVSWR